MVKKVFSAFTVLLIIFTSCCFDVCGLSVSASSAVLMVADTGEVLFEKNAHERRSMASTTKIMTALLTAECATPDRVVVATPEMVNVEGTSMGLKAGDKVSFRDLIYGMLLASGNDAANTAAISIDGSITSFAVRMNKRAAEIGMKNTNFVTPSGLDDENHYSTAYDMALLGCCALRNVVFFEACSARSAKLCYGNEPYTRYLSNHNRLLKSFDGAIGIKTGFTKKSGRCLVSAAVRDGVTLICVTLNAPDDWNDHQKMLEYGFEQAHLKTIDVDLPDLKVVGGAENSVSLSLSSDLSLASACEISEFDTEINLKPFEYAPVKKGDVVGNVRVMLSNKTVAEVSVIAVDSVECITPEKLDKPSVFSKIKSFLKKIVNKIKGLFKKGKRLEK